MKTVTIRYEFPDEFNHDNIVHELNGALTDTNQELADQITYTIIERR